MKIKDARRIVCEQTGEFVHATLDDAEAWLKEAHARSIQPVITSAGNEVWHIYRLGGGREVVLADFCEPDNQLSN